MQIWKYSLKNHEEVLEIPKGFKILSVISQYNNPTVYCLVDPETEKEKVEFFYFGTGWDLTENVNNLDFLGTVSTYNDSLIWHVFKR